jgi:hypothetical protein
VLQLEAILVEDPQMNRPVGTEKPRSWKVTNETTYPLGGHGTDSSPDTFHSTVTVSGGSCPASTRLQLVARHVGSRPVRHGDSKVSSESVAQAVAVRAQGSKRSEAQGQKKMTRE